ncbi:hypothetical protein GCM10009122_60210 [Fulvivirga kasyanovii]|uniref:STAS/SEC14 domain-containing protein n=1 Tax=Fulvivirga kasyanovii TaxID=396812 RepID=A0ABW9RN27_9BACT|nr:STAS/SEC14 domain-containing protein [Fulvivirga kasyanovii]MTI25529.1 hypothetical protein [Fulvivirga kasyanovii]
MKIETFYTQGESTLNYDPSVPCIIVNNVGFATSEEFRALLNKGLEFLIEKQKIHGKIGWLSNLVQADAYSEDDMKWVATDFDARAYEAGVRHVSFVLAEDAYAFANFSAETYQKYSQEEIGEKIVIRNFKDEASAKAWLREVLSRQ